MAKTFDPNRVLPGTIELVRDANGNYTTKVVGLETINSLSLPDISTTAAVTKTDTDTKTATDITGDTIQKQTQMAFKTGDDNQPDTTGSMLQDEAKKTSDMLANVSTPTTIQDSMIRSNRFDADTFDDEVGSRIEIKDPTSTVFGRPKEGTIDQAAIDRQTQKNLGLAQPELKGSAAVQRGEAEPPGFDFSFLKGDKFKEGTSFARPKEGTIDQAAANNMTQEGTAFARPDRGTIDQMAADSLGISADPTALSTQAEQEAAALGVPDRFKGVSQEGALAGEGEKQDVKPEVKQSALKTLGNSITTALKNIKTPGMMLIQAVARPESNIQKLNKSYFTDRGDGRIGGNPATDLYAGFNRTSAFGNLEAAGKKRISTREKTIARKGYKEGDKFYDDTQKMKEQQKDYQRQKAATQKATQGPAGQGGASGSDSGKIVCTMMNESYGFGSFRNKIWMKFHGNIAPEYQKGYHKLFLPLVNYAKQKGITNKIIKNILEHIAVHSTIDMRQTLRGKRHTLGRLYRKVILPLCYWAGKK
jgi:hypothetical protein